MTEQVTKLRVFVASPGDVRKERELLGNVIGELNRGIAGEKGLVLELVRWETHAWPDIGEDAQEVINRQIAPGDVFVGIMWNRFGTPTKRAESGTKEEFDRAYAYWKQYGRPKIMFYFNLAPFSPYSMDELEQKGKVLTFKEELSDKGALYWKYNGADEFERLVRRHLTQVIRQETQVITEPDYFEARVAPPPEPHIQPFDHSICQSASFADLDMDKTNKFFKRNLVQRQQDFRPGASLQDQLRQFGLLRESNPTYGALLCFGQNPQILLPGALTRCIHWRGNTRQYGWQDDQEYRGDLLSQFGSSLAFLRKCLHFSRVIGREGRTEQCEIPFVALEEVLANALIHREYANRLESVQVEIFDNRIEIRSPGQLPPPMTLELLGVEGTCHPRNPLIARIFYLCGHVEKVGSGIQRMQRAMEDTGLPPPEFELSDAQTLQVILYRPRQVPEEIVESEEFGTLLSQGIKGIVATGEKTLDTVEEELATVIGLKSGLLVHKWRQGVVPSRSDQIAALARACVQLGGMDENWLRAFLREARYLTPESLIVELFPGTPYQRPLAEPLDLDTLREVYLAHLRRTYRHLDFKGIPQLERLATFLPLDRMYVGLQVLPDLPPGETWVRVAGRVLDEATLAEMEAKSLERRMGTAEPMLVEHLLKEHPGLVVLGDPGAGKSTLLKVLALACAEGRTQERLGLEGEWLPILLPLAAYAAALKSKDCSLLDFLPDYFRVRGLDCDAGPLLANALKRGRVLVLLDGLDEVLEGRAFVAARVEDFFQQYAPVGNRLVVTSRIVGYPDAPLRAEGLTTVTLVDFQREQIEQFAHNWCHAFEVSTYGDTPEAHRAAEAEKGELLRAIFSNLSVKRLASNPLLLTILALIKRQGVTLPHRRVELYELYLRTLIAAWSQARALDHRPLGPEMDYLETAQVLAPLALWLRETHPGAGLAPRREVENWLAHYYQNEWWLAPAEARQRARGFLAAVHSYSNLLVERGKGTYGFIHLTFEEYLAARGIAQLGELDVGDTVRVLCEHLADPAWHETILLTVGYLGIVQGSRRMAAAVVEGLLEANVSSAERGWNVVVAGKALHDVGAAGVTEGCRQRVLKRLVSVMQDVDVRPVYRRQAGLLLGWLGWQPDDLDDWVEISAGPFVYGDEMEKCLIERTYRIGKYPVTNAQFARFIEAEGYDDERWWSEEGLAWKRAEQRNHPQWWDDPERANPLVPVVGVSWYEAEAYCRWLTEELQKAGILEENEVARLPTEEEWERAARGTDGREYPWGKGFDVARANLDIVQPSVKGTTAVMTYPGGVSPDRVWDCSGNVWEWTGSLYQKSETWVLRGGSWLTYDKWYARCSYRLRSDHPVRSFNNYSFRVCVVSRQD